MHSPPELRGWDAQCLLRLPRPPAGYGVPASTSTVQQERAAGLEPATTALANAAEKLWLFPALPLSYARLVSIVKVLLLRQLDQDSNLEPLSNGQV
jgi:hypothetical protein